jgi:hypothetical protein
VNQQIGHVLNGWLEGTPGSPARFQMLTLLRGIGDRYVLHQEILAALQVKRIVAAIKCSDGQGLSFGNNLTDFDDLLTLLRQRSSLPVTKPVCDP